MLYHSFIVNRMAITAGAIRRYCELKGDSFSQSAQMRALVPVAFPRSTGVRTSPSKALRNYWAFVSCAMPINASTCKDRLTSCTAAMNTIKKTYAAPIQMWIQSNILPLLPQFLRRKTAYDIFSRHSIVFSNVPGPPEAIHFAGERILGIQVVFPNLLPQCLILSYAGEIFMNMVLDCSVIKEGDVLLPRLFIQEAIDMAKEYGLEMTETDIASPKSKQGVFGIISA
jgi:WS/DGAT C-terminal domain